MKLLKLFACCVVLSLGSFPAGAVAPVIDKANIAQAKLQLTQMKEDLENQIKQLEGLTDIKGLADEQLKAFGELGKINIPTLNFLKISGQLSENMSCLMPDYESLMPSIGEEDIDLGSVCGRGKAYEKGMFADKKTLKKQSAREKLETINGVRKQRKKVTRDATTKGLAHGDMAIEASAETVRAAQELKNSAASAQTVNERLQVISETNIALLQSQAVTNQLLAQLLKVVSSLAIEMLVDVEADLGEGTGE